jgi:protein-ribulosamine 3-kinase
LYCIPKEKVIAMGSSSAINTLQAFLEERGISGTIQNMSPVGGGCIGDAQKIDHSAGSYFVKIMPVGQREVLEAEADGLRALGEPGVIAVPRVLGTGSLEDGRGFLVLEWIQQRPGSRVDQGVFGRQLAQLHRSTNQNYGWNRDNFIGSNPQINTPENSWVQFFARHRLGYQYALGKKNGQIGGDFAHRLQGFIQNLGDFLTEPQEGPSLVHGDLWGGNWIAGEEGQGVIIDPAVYYGHREVDLAMTEMFGGFSSAFYKGYQEEWPLSPGYEERKQLYNLYHYLNHLNIFGASYRGACLGILRYFQ